MTAVAGRCDPGSGTSAAIRGGAGQARPARAAGRAGSHLGRKVPYSSTAGAVLFSVCCDLFTHPQGTLIRFEPHAPPLIGRPLPNAKLPTRLTCRVVGRCRHGGGHKPLLQRAAGAPRCGPLPCLRVLRASQRRTQLCSRPLRFADKLASSCIPNPCCCCCCCEQASSSPLVPVNCIYTLNPCTMYTHCICTLHVLPSTLKVRTSSGF